MVNAKLTICVTVVTVIFVLLYFNDTFERNIDDDEWIQYTEESLQKNNYDDLENNTEFLFERCDLPFLDPWDSLIVKRLKPLKDRTKLCRSNVKQFSKLIKGQLFLFLPHNGNISCQRRCLFSKSDHELKFGEWIKVENGTRPKCDVFEIECGEAQNNANYLTFYKFLHSQIYRPDKPKILPAKKPVKPDVHIIVLDSVSESQFLRSMPKTRYILQEHYDALPFQHLNKVGLNSRPNGFAFLLGKSIYSIAKSIVSRGYQSDYKDEEFCTKHLDHDQFIGFRFQDDGYVTMMSEDWAEGVFNWPNCKGFKDNPTDHYMRPFQIRIEGNKTFRDHDMKNIIYRYSCQEAHQYNMRYLQDFIDAYPDKPKFSMTWMSYLAHGDINGLYHADDFFYRFFIDNKDKFNNSYVIIMGDHGNRYNPFRDTLVGEAEDNNPFLFISVPAIIKKNISAMENLRQNTKQLITHYDIYATLNEITNPTNSRIPKPLIKGSSLFHPLPQPRTCDKLRIPFEYCLCNAKKNKLPKNNEIAISGAEFMIARMNADLQSSSTTSGCSVLTLNVGKEITVYQLNITSNAYHISYTTLPGNGQFSGFISIIDKKMSFLSEKIARLNGYAVQTKCASNSKFISYCYCKNLIKQSPGMPTVIRKHVISNFID